MNQMDILRIQIKWKILWNDIYFSALHNTLSGVISQVYGQLSVIFEQLNTIFRRYYEVISKPQKDRVEHKKEQKIHSNTSGYHKIEKRARSNCRK